MELRFVLRGVQEHYDLMVRQLNRVFTDRAIYTDEVHYKYTEYISKNNQHGFIDHKMKNKHMPDHCQITVWLLFWIAIWCCCPPIPIIVFAS